MDAHLRRDAHTKGRPNAGLFIGGDLHRMGGSFFDFGLIEHGAIWVDVA